jgi:hypothetical protein
VSDPVCPPPKTQSGIAVGDALLQVDGVDVGSLPLKVSTLIPFESSACTLTHTHPHPPTLTHTHPHSPTLTHTGLGTLFLQGSFCLPRLLSLSTQYTRSPLSLHIETSSLKVPHRPSEPIAVPPTPPPRCNSMQTLAEKHMRGVTGSWVELVLRSAGSSASYSVRLQRK